MQHAQWDIIVLKGNKDILEKIESQNFVMN